MLIFGLEIEDYSPRVDHGSHCTVLTSTSCKYMKEQQPQIDHQFCVCTCQRVWLRSWPNMLRERTVETSCPGLHQSPTAFGGLQQHAREIQPCWRENAFLLVIMLLLCIPGLVLSSIGSAVLESSQSKSRNTRMAEGRYINFQCIEAGGSESKSALRSQALSWQNSVTQEG